MLTHLEAENFQSLRRLSLKLGKFTVVTGATGSGKSAVLRAVRLLAFNARGTGYITRGAKSCVVGAGDAEQGWTAVVDRRVSGRGDCYWLEHQQASGDEPHVETWTKLAGGVPEQVQAALRLSELNFAAQFDRPFLLDASGGEVARVLGRLTNVTLLFEAARECARRRLEVLGDLKRAEARLAELTQAAQRFAGMRERRAAVQEAEEALERVRDTEDRLGRLRALTARLEAAQAALERAAPPPVPDGARLGELAGKLARLRDLAAALQGGELTAEVSRMRACAADRDEEAAHARLHEVLAVAGQCPTCGSVIS